MMRPTNGMQPPKAATKTCIIIAGPTAVGKTALAIAIAQHFSTSIISCDSRQCFMELAIGVARPSTAELATVKHHFIASHSIHELVTAATFERYALDKLTGIFQQHDVAVMVGGTGLYIKAFCEGLDEVPAIEEHIRQRIIDQYRVHGMNWLRAQVEVTDPQYFASGEIQNPQRMMRALEVKQSTGKSILDYHTGSMQQRDFQIIKIGVEMPRPLLVERINQRVDAMMAQGLMEEVRGLLPWQHLNALQTVGYKELFSYFNGTSTLAGAIESIKINTRQYAKRQMTWFRKDVAMRWCPPNVAEVISTIETFMLQQS